MAAGPRSRRTAATERIREHGCRATGPRKRAACYRAPVATALLAPLLVALAAFQSHWLDDAWTGAPDAAGVTVSAIGSGLLLLGWWLWPRRTARWFLGIAWTVIAYISVADLTGLQPDGSFASPLRAHWVNGLGLAATAAVTVALLASVAGFWRLWKT